MYANELNHLILISLLKEHNIRQVVASPGVNNMRLVYSLQQDPFFKIYSCVDERSAAYIACGLAAESQSPVMLTCTGATASRNYMPGLTEAFYRKLPILAVTSTRDIGKIGQYTPQLLDRRVVPNDVVVKSVHIPIFHTKDDEENYTVLLNDALLELRHHGGGPVHVNLTSSYSRDYSIDKLPRVRPIRRYTYGDTLPNLNFKKVGLYIRSHAAWSKQLHNAVNEFCEKYNAVVFADQTSNYHGPYGVYSTLITSQQEYRPQCCNFDLMIYIGSVDGSDYDALDPVQVWRVCQDGIVRSPFGKLSSVFEMKEEDFFHYYNRDKDKKSGSSFYKEWNREYEKVLESLPEFPLSNILVAKELLQVIPAGSTVHYGIQNSLRSWNFFKPKNEIRGYANTGGFGIDGSLSSLIGASLFNASKLYFGIIGDLSFFYDINVLGNRHVGKNIRLILINNGLGQQFKNPGSAGGDLGAETDKYIAAAGHYGCKSANLVKHFAEDLGFKYLSADNIETFRSNIPAIISDGSDKSIIFEIFAETEDESEAMFKIKHVITSSAYKNSAKAKKMIKKVLGEKGTDAIRKLLRDS